jgi:hypothetical protein
MRLERDKSTLPEIRELHRVTSDGQEQIAWSGRPDPRRQVVHALSLNGRPWMAGLTYALVIPFSVMELIFVGRELPRLLAASDELWVGVLFAFVLLSGLLSWFLVVSPRLAARAARRTVYAVTDRRVVIVREGLRRRARGTFLHTFLVGVADVERVAMLARRLQPASTR